MIHDNPIHPGVELIYTIQQRHNDFDSDMSLTERRFMGGSSRPKSPHRSDTEQFIYIRDGFSQSQSISYT